MAGLVFRVNATPISWDEAVALAAGSGTLATFGEVVSTGFIEAFAPNVLIPGPSDEYYDLARIGWVNSEFGGSGSDLTFVGYGEEAFEQFGTNPHSYVFKTAGRLIGTSGADILYLTSSGVAEGGAGSDQLWDSSGADTLLGGAGVDYIWSRGGADTIVDGTGSDFVYASRSSWIKASLDGDNDYFQGGKLDYSRTSLAINVTEFGVDGYGAMTVSNAEIGEDSISSQTSLVTGSGDDVILWRSSMTLTTGAGNDTVVGGLLDFSGHALFDLGTGDDHLTLGYSGGRALGGSGNDTLIAIVTEEAGHIYEFTGGAGHDDFVIHALSGSTGTIKIWDYTLDGPSSDTLHLYLDIEASLDLSAARADGYVKLHSQGGYTMLQIDSDGGGNNYQDLAIFKGTFGAEFWDNVAWFA